MSDGSLRQQLSACLREALEVNAWSQADLARETGLSAKHINHMCSGKLGTTAMYDYAAFALGYRWEVAVIPAGSGVSHDTKETT